MLLFAIESRTARLANHDREAITHYLSPETAAEGERAFLEALAAGRDGAIKTSIQDLELYAIDWQPLVPDDANLRSALAYLLAEKYRFTEQNVPALRRTLGLDTQPVQQAYQRLYSRPLSTIYVPEISPAEWLHWTWSGLVARLENLPPFWMAFLLTLPGQAGLLAMPIALAGIGLSTAIAILIVFGAINMLTAAALAESVARSGTTRFGLGFLTQLVNEYLGPAGSLLTSILLSLNNFFVLIVFFLGVAGTLQDVTRLPGILWGAVLFAVCFYFLNRRSFGATVGTTILIVIVNLLITIAIPLIVLPHVKAVNLTNLQPPFSGISFQPAIWQLVLGVMLSMYFSHIIIVAYAPVVLRRDPAAGSWIKGSVAAIFSTMIIAVLWIVVVTGAISPQELAKTVGTVITPLVVLAGPVVALLGSILVVLSLGLAAIQIALVLYFETNEIISGRASGKLGKRTRFLLAISPVILVFLITDWIFLSGQSSFTSILGTVCAISLPLIGGMLPVLLLASTRRKGDFSTTVVNRWLGNPLLLGGLYIFFLASIFLHSLYLWSDPITKTIAFLVGLAILIATLIMLRQGMLRPRLVIEVRQNENGRGGSLFTITANGRPTLALVNLTYLHDHEEIHAAVGSIAAFALLKSVSFQFASMSAPELKVWVHRVSPEGGSQGIPVNVQVMDQSQLFAGDQPPTDDCPVAVEQTLTSGLGTLPLTRTACQVLITFLPTTDPAKAAA